MLYAKIKFTEWRDSAAPLPDDHGPELAALEEQEAGIREQIHETRDLQKIAETPERAALLGSLADKIGEINAQRRALRQAQAAAAKVAAKDMKSHPKVGTIGYQVIDPVKMEVILLVDDAGNPLPADAVHGHEVVRFDVPKPAFAAALEAQLAAAAEPGVGP